MMKTLRAILLLITCLAVTACTSRNQVVVGPESVLSYVLSCYYPPHGFGHRDFPHVTLSHTWHALRTLKALNSPIPAADSCSRYISSVVQTPQAGPWHQYRQLMSLADLGVSPPPGTGYRILRMQHREGGWPGPDGYVSIDATYRAVTLLQTLGSTPLRRENAARFLVERLHRDGGFRDIPRSAAADDSVSLPEADMLHTCQAVHALRILGYEIPWKRSVVAWIRSCQRKNGGFAPTVSSPVTDVWYTSLAISALRVLGTAPIDSIRTVEFVNSCQNADGGFGDRPGSASRLAATHYAVSALEALCGSPTSGIHSKSVPLAAYAELPDTSAHTLHAYPGPMPGTKHRAERMWWPGVPMYALPDSLEQIQQYVGSADLHVTDSTLTTFLWQVPYPAFPESLTTAQITFLTGTSSGPRVVQALRSVWDLHTGSDLTFGQTVGRITRIMNERNVVTCIRAGTGNQFRDYRMMDDIITHTATGCTYVVAYSDGTSTLEHSPWMERLLCSIPGVVLIGGSDPANNRIGCMIWCGSGGDGEFLDALREGRVVCAFASTENSTARLLQGDPAITSAVSHRLNGNRW